MNSQATPNEGDSLISDLSDEAPSYSTFAGVNQQPNEVIKARKKSSMEFPLLVKTRSNIQVYIIFFKCCGGEVIFH